MIICEFECLDCMEDFECDWTFGDSVICPHCGTEWDTDSDESYDGDIQGPWLYGKREQ